MSIDYEKSPFWVRITAKEESSLELGNLSAFLYDLVILHDRLIMLLSEEYAYKNYLSFYFYRRSGRPIKKPDRLQVMRISKESPLSVDLLIPAAIAVPGLSWTLIQILEKIADWKNDRAIKQLGKRSLELDVARKEIEFRQSVERDFTDIFSHKYSDQTQQIVDAIVKDALRLGNNEQITIDKVESFGPGGKKTWPPSDDSDNK